MGNKYIICDYAKANWGKTETLLEVISLLKGNPKITLIYEKPNTEKDKWCHFKMNGKSVVISTLGDPNSEQPIWLEDAAKTGAQIIVTASRTRGSTIDVVYDIAKKYDYEIIWFQNFHFDNPALVGLLPMADIRAKDAKCLIDFLEIL